MIASHNGDSDFHAKLSNIVSSIYDKHDKYGLKTNSLKYMPTELMMILFSCLENNQVPATPSFQKGVACRAILIKKNMARGVGGGVNE